MLLIAFGKSGDISGQAVKAQKGRGTTSSSSNSGVESMFQYVRIEKSISQKDLSCSEVCYNEFASSFPDVKCAFAVVNFNYKIKDESSALSSTANLNMASIDPYCIMTNTLGKTIYGTFEESWEDGYYFGLTTFEDIICACYTG